MRILITGDRNWADYNSVYRVLVSHRISSLTVIHGGARGADSIAGEIADKLDYWVECYPADWKQYGRAAGPIRNKQMLVEGEPDICHAFHDDLDNSKGTRNMVAQCLKAGVPVFLTNSSGGTVQVTSL